MKKMLLLLLAALMSLGLFISSGITAVAADTAPVPAAATSVNSTISAGTDYVDVYYDGASRVWDIGDIDVFAGYFDPTIQRCGTGLRFANIDIPQNAVITAAYLTFTSRIDTSAGIVNTVITGDREADASAFTTLADYQGRRGTDVGGVDNTKRTMAQVSWDNIEPWVTGNQYQSPDISRVIQEIVDRAGWVSGKHLALFWDDYTGRSTEQGVLSNSSTWAGREAFSYLLSPAQSPQLHIEYTVPESRSGGSSSGGGTVVSGGGGTCSSGGTATVSGGGGSCNSGSTAGTPGQIKDTDDSDIGKAIGQDETPGQIKQFIDSTIGKVIGKADAPGQIKDANNHAIGKAIGQDEAPGQIKQLIDSTIGKMIGKGEAPGQIKQFIDSAIGKAIGKANAPGQNKDSDDKSVGKDVGKAEAPGQNKK